MPLPTITISAASRLHFGLLSLGGADRRTFGGIGVMVRPPEVQISIDSSGEFRVEGPMSDRVREAAVHWQRFWQRPNLPACRIVLDAVPRLHSGLGIGTQLALSVARGLNRFHQFDELSPEALARCAGRGLRSAVGTYGFFHGGLIYETGKVKPDRLGTLAQRIPLPESWRFVLIDAATDQGLHGLDEQQVFDRLPSPSPSLSTSLVELAEKGLLPAAAEGSFDRFSRAVYEFGNRSGSLFSEVQGGSYNGPRLTKLVEAVRDLGTDGVGQSSWGPTIFALCPDQSAAEGLRDKLKRLPIANGADLTITQPCNHAAVLGEKHG